MDCSHGDRIAVEALRLGLPARSVQRISTPLTLDVETLVLRHASEEPAPLVMCLHPGRLCEFQAAQRMRDLVRLEAHIAFPRGLHAHHVDLGGARTVGYGWYHDTGDNPIYRRSLEQAAAYLGDVLARLLERLSVRPGATFVIGAEDTTLLAVIFAMQQEREVAGAAIVGGTLPPAVLADFVPAQRRTRFLRIHRCMRRPHQDVPADPESDQLRALGYQVEVEILQGEDRRWQDGTACLLSWLAREVGQPVHDPF